VFRSHTIRQKQAVELLCMSDQLVAEAGTDITQTNTSDKRPVNGIRTLDPSNKAASDLRLRPHENQNHVIQNLLECLRGKMCRKI